MTPLHRKTSYLVALATVATALTGFVVAGNAFGAEWREYEGRVSAGQAYLVSVPDDADGLQLAFQAGLLGGGQAKATLFDPADERVGHYLLNAEAKEITIDEVDEGDYVLYVFEVTGGVLTVSVKADAEDLALVPIETRTDNLEVARQEGAAAFRAVNTFTLDREPVFESLLYQGNAVNLTGSVRSLEGVTASVDKESGTAHGPGLFTQQVGSRASFPENFGAGLHTVDALADEFEGTLFLTVVHYVRPGESAVDRPSIPELPPNALVLDEGWEATAIEVGDAGALTLGLVPTEDEEEDEEHEGDATPDGEKRHSWRHHDYATLAVYTPDDELLAFVELDEETPVQTLALDDDGEYVIFVYASGPEGVFAVLDGGATAFEGTRHLRTDERAIVLADADSPLPFDAETTIDLDRAPLAVGLGVQGDLAYALDLSGEVHNDAGSFHLYAWQMPELPGPWMRWGHMQHVGEELVSGAWAIDLQSTSAMGDVTLYLLEYDRAIEVDEDDEDEA